MTSRGTCVTRVLNAVTKRDLDFSVTEPESSRTVASPGFSFAIAVPTRPAMTTQTAPIPWKHIRYILILFAPLWVGSTVLFAMTGVFYSVASQEYWTASQPMVLRDEANGAIDRLGRFSSQTELKAAQETILEMARNHEVVKSALKIVGPGQGSQVSDWPTSKDITTVAEERINIVAPQGAEFGGSEMIYLQVEDTTPQRAMELCEAVYMSLSQRMRDVRRVRADSMIAELTHARDLAQRHLDEASNRMREIEVRFGSDLGELRNLNESITGDGANRRALEETNRELQIAELELERLNALYRLLEQGLTDPKRLLVSGGDLLSRQPSLQRLKDGLIDAQLRHSQLAGSLTVDNPKMKASLAVENEIRLAMQSEIALAIRSMQPVLDVETDRVERLANKQLNLQKRLDRLAEGRTAYSKIAAEVKHRTTLLEESQRVLAEAEASRSASLSINLLAKLGSVSTGDSPNGMSTTMMTAGSAAAGLIFGLGTVFLVSPGPNQSRFGRRWSDMLGGRRASDQAERRGTA
jgi:succinoglycan biosynthesis transport protein ExoP